MPPEILVKLQHKSPVLYCLFPMTKVGFGNNEAEPFLIERGNSQGVHHEIGLAAWDSKL